MRRCILLSVALLLNVSAAMAKPKDVLPYRNPALSIDERVADLLSRMTTEEKVGQLRCTMAWNYYEIKEKGKKGKEKREVVPSESFKKDIAEGQVGMLWATYRADPWTQKSLENGLTPELAAQAGNALQRYVLENTRLGIPLFLAEEAPHGHMAIGATVFPTGLAMAATWSPELIERAGKVIANEIRLQGGHISYGPVLDLARDPRWSRVEETMGEDPVLTGELGAAMVRGLGGGDISKPDATIATLKHFIAYGTTEGGQNGNPTVLGQRELHESFLPPFRKAIDAGALSVMTSYNSMDGIPCTANEYLLTDLLRHQWQFRGFVVSDLFSIDGIAGTHRVAADRRQAALMALQAGVDVDLGASCYAQLSSLTPPLGPARACSLDTSRTGRSTLGEPSTITTALDSAVARILRLKFEMGLFDNPYVDTKAARTVGNDTNKAVALDVARAAVTLLKNAPSTLPLSKSLRLLVCGPNADNRYNMLGDYTAPQADGDVITILDGIRAKLPAAQVEYVKGCAVRDTTESNIPEAVAAAAHADVIVCCVGGSSARDFKTSYKETGAAVTDSKTVSDMDCGEGFDRATLTLLGHQQQLLEALKRTGKPLVVIYIEGRPMDKSWAAVNADALLTAYYPGGQGGTAIADVLFGDYNPAGRLPVSVPAHIGQLPVYYNKKAPRPHDYVEMSAAPLYPFGFGLSYTTFAYKNLRITPLTSQSSPSQSDPHRSEAALYTVSLDVTNTGSCDGEEVVQLYLRDDIASTVQPLLQLKAFQRIFVPKGETRTATMTLTADDFAIVDRQLHRVIEPGTFTLMIGRSSADILLKETIVVN